MIRWREGRRDAQGRRGALGVDRLELFDQQRRPHINLELPRRAGLGDGAVFGLGDDGDRVVTQPPQRIQFRHEKTARRRLRLSLSAMAR